MFVSMPEFQFSVPAGLAVPGAVYARAMGLSTCAAWYVLTIRGNEAGRPLHTFLLAWDSDVINAIQTADGKLVSLMFIAPRAAAAGSGWYAKEIVEVWEASDPEQEDGTCVMMVTADGEERAGYFMESTRGIKRRSLVARTPHATRRKKVNA